MCLFKKQKNSQELVAETPHVVEKVRKQWVGEPCPDNFIDFPQIKIVSRLKSLPNACITARNRPTPSPCPGGVSEHRRPRESSSSQKNGRMQGHHASQFWRASPPPALSLCLAASVMRCFQPSLRVLMQWALPRLRCSGGQHLGCKQSCREAGRERSPKLQGGAFCRVPFWSSRWICLETEVSIMLDVSYIGKGLFGQSGRIL